MNLRDCLVRHGIVDSPRLCALPLAVQIFYRNILHACDGAGRFRADADDLRLTLYRCALDRVTRRHITSWLQSLHHAGLVRLYTGPDGKGYCEVLNYGQRDKNRRVIHPAPDADRLNFESPATADPPGDSPPDEVNGREVSVPAEIPAPPPPTPSAAPTHTHTDSPGKKRSHEETLASALERLRRKFPGLDLEAEIARAEAYVRQQRGPTAKLSLYFFEEKWLPKEGGPTLTATAKIAKIPGEPEYWRELLNEEYPDSVYSRGGEKEGTAWKDLPAYVRDLVLSNLGRWLKQTGRAA